MEFLFDSITYYPGGEIGLNLKLQSNETELLLLILGILYASFWPIHSSAQPIAPANFRSINIGQITPNEVILRLKPGVTEAQLNGILAPFGLRRIEGNISSGTQRVLIPSSNAMEMAAVLNGNPLIDYAEPNYIARAEVIPNDPYYIYQWNLPMISTELAWNLSIGTNVVVAVIDTGVAYENQGIYVKAPDLAGTLFIPGWDFVNDDAYADDDNGHGTHITGTIAQTTNNLLGVAGVAYGCTIMPVKVLDSASNGLISDIADGIYFAVNNGAHIINISFGTYTPSLTLQNAVNYAYLNGVSVITSAGNNATGIAHYPSSYATCVCVSAVRYDKTSPFYSNYGADIDVCAPGGDLSVDQNLDGHVDGICQQTHNGTNVTLFNYALYQGTSCAAAHTTGVAALIQSVAGSTLSPDEVKSVLETTAIDLGTVGWDQDFGWGLINAFNAVQAVLPAATAAALGSLVPWSFVNPVSDLRALILPPILPFNGFLPVGAFSSPWFAESVNYPWVPIPANNLIPVTANNPVSGWQSAGNILSRQSAGNISLPFILEDNPWVNLIEPVSLIGPVGFFGTLGSSYFNYLQSSILSQFLNPLLNVPYFLYQNL